MSTNELDFGFHLFLIKIATCDLTEISLTSTILDTTELDYELLREETKFDSSLPSTWHSVGFIIIIC